jgi:hypothetical protein
MRGMNSRTQGRDGYDVPTAHHAHGRAIRFWGFALHSGGFILGR